MKRLESGKGAVKDWLQWNEKCGDLLFDLGVPALAIHHYNNMVRLVFIQVSISVIDKAYCMALIHAKLPILAIIRATILHQTVGYYH